MEIINKKREVTIKFSEDDMKEIVHFMYDKNVENRLLGVNLTPLGKLLDIFEKELE